MSSEHPPEASGNTWDHFDKGTFRDEGPQWPEPNRPRRRGPGAVIGFVALIVVMGGVVAYFVDKKVNPRALPPRPVESQEKRFRDAREAFAAEPLQGDNEEQLALQKAFDQLGKAFRAKSSSQISRLLDAPRLLGEVERQGVIDSQIMRSMRAQPDLAQNRLAAQLARDADLYAFARCEIKTVKLDSQRGEAMVYVRHWTEDGFSAKFRWWLRKNKGRWRIYDYEDLSVSMRLTDLFAAGAQMAIANPTKLTELQAKANNLRNINRALAMEDFKTAEREMAQLESSDLSWMPTPLKATRWFSKGMIQHNREDYEDALASYDKAYALKNDMVIIQLMKANVYNSMGKHKEAQTWAEKYVGNLGPDSDGCIALGFAQEKLGLKGKAAVNYRKALDDDPESIDGLISLALVLPKEKVQEVVDRLLRTSKPEKQFQEVCFSLIDEDDIEAMAAVVQAYGKARPNDPFKAYFDAWVKAEHQKYDKSIAIMRTILDKGQSQAERDRFTTLYCHSMFHGGKGIEGYRTAPQKNTAFRELAQWAIRDRKYDVLRALVPLHKKQNPQDPALHRFAGEIAFLDKKWDTARESFRSALSVSQDKKEREELQNRLVEAFFRSDQILQGYSELRPKRQVFQSLARMIVRRSDLTALESLIAAHAKAEPADPELSYYRATISFRLRKYAESAALLKPVLRSAPPGRSDQFQSLFLNAMTKAGQALRGYAAAVNRIDAFRHLSGSLLEQNRTVDLIRLIDLHALTAAQDPWLEYYRGRLAESEKKWGVAAAAFQRGYEMADERNRGSFRTAWIANLYRDGKAKTALTTIEPTRMTFWRLARMMDDEKKHKELAELIAVHRQKDADDPELTFFAARLMLAEKKYAAAAAQVKPIMNTVEPSWRRHHFVSLYFGAMAMDGKANEALATAPDSGAAFQQLARILLSEKRTADLSRLIAARKKQAPDDLWRYRVMADLAGQRKDLQGVADAYMAGYQHAKRKKPKANYRFMYSLAPAMYKADRTLEALRTISPVEKIFPIMAGAISRDGKADELLKLVTAYRKIRPQDPNLPFWDAEVLYLRKDYETALKRFREQKPALNKSVNSWRAGNRLTYCLIRLKRYDEAISSLREFRGFKSTKYEMDDAVWYKAVIGAAKGDVAATVAALELCLEDGYDTWEFYDDEIVGAALRSEAFKAARQKFPEDKKSN